MSLFVDLKFIGEVSYLLKNFKRKADYLYNFTCPNCDDNKNNKLRARGYIYRWKDSLRYKCHHCGASSFFGDLIKELDVEIHKKYLYETFLEKAGDTKPAEKRAVEKFKPKKTYKPLKPVVLAGCPSIASLGPDHPARIYIESRKLPELFLKQIFWTDDFPGLVDKVCPGHRYALKPEGRIVIPFLDSNFDLLAIQGRSLGKGGIRYITIKAFEDAPRIYGMHRLGKVWKRIYIVEGPFDSMFLPNCLAIAGSDIPHSLPIDRVLVVYDNEPHKKDTCHKIEKAIDKGYRVCIWPDTIKNKDINDMVTKGGIPADKIRTIIDQNSCAGLEAKLRLQHWRKA